MSEVMAQIATIIFMAWFVWFLLMHLRRRKVVGIQAETRSKILEKIGAGQEMMEFMKTEAGQRMLESLPVEAESRTPKDFNRILRAVQAGVVLTVLGAGIIIANESYAGEPDASVVGAIVVALGIGFLLAGGASYWLSKSWGLLDEKPAE